jgi:transcriptional regulator with XRE-family HTH domain
MTLGEKLRYLRSVEGTLRGLDREMTQTEVARAIQRELKQTISQAYLSQIEGGSRPHMTNKTRALLAKFFKVHPGFLVADPEGYHMELQSDLRTSEGKLDLWLLQGAERFRTDHELGQALHCIARQQDSRRSILLLAAILETPGLAERLMELLKPSAAKHDRTPSTRLAKRTRRNHDLD